MATSGSVDFNLNRQEIIETAFILANAVDTGESIPASDGKTAARLLNLMIKSWQKDDINIWKKAQATVILQKGQAAYTLGPSGDHVTESYVQTTLDDDEVSGSTILTVVSTSGMTVGDYIGIELDTGYLHWTTIATIPDSTTVTITNSISSDAASGNYVYAYTTKVQKPTQLWGARRVYTTELLEVPLMQMSYDQYMAQPNKSQQSTPTSFMYSQQRASGVLYVWMTPPSVRDRIKITMSKPIEDLDAALNDPDFPQEWLETIAYNLAIRLCLAYGKAKGEQYQNLRAEALSMMEGARGYNLEYGTSLYFQPSSRGGA